ncbi:DUF2500 domain-containing protein [Neobacillus notoginsengisoli]|uniref:DUF2500 domain-containing protein n=2 Tax=Neobacillus notoginsengisoli TaxID=1578198 RepID=A0A417YXP2_9BACI|nr:DUF2500 domain-containing protein [Neobacillus notoginsengisoli]RHW42316.1 DUF2500 domain-containing protein [Neobacillus notoginsengisoli]
MEAGFDMFDMMSVIVPVFFVIIIGIFIFSISKGISEWSNNNKQPRLSVNAKVVSKRTKVSGGMNDHSSSTHYFTTFEVESGDRLEFNVSGYEYGQLAEGDAGELTFQGTRYLGFNRNKAQIVPNE